MISSQKHSKILLPRNDLESFLESVKSSSIEVGGILIGYSKGDSIICKKILVGRNILNSPYRFRLDDSFVAEAVSKLSGDEDIVGIIHSHPAYPAPSELDRRFMELWPVVWVIVDSRTLEYKAWMDMNELETILY